MPHARQTTNAVSLFIRESGLDYGCDEHKYYVISACSNSVSIYVNKMVFHPHARKLWKVCHIYIYICVDY